MAIPENIMVCRYCGKETNKDYCSFKCRKAYLDYYDEEDKFKGRRKTLILISIAVSIPFIVLFMGAGITMMFVLIGSVVITHPFTSQELRKKLTVKEAKKRMMMNGAILIIIGLPFLLLTHSWLF